MNERIRSALQTAFRDMRTSTLFALKKLSLSEIDIEALEESGVIQVGEDGDVVLLEGLR